jgi:hypothetical protein
VNRYGRDADGDVPQNYRPRSGQERTCGECWVKDALDRPVVNEECNAGKRKNSDRLQETGENAVNETWTDDDA